MSDRLYMYTCDISDKSMVEKKAKQTLKDLGRMDVLINNAGTVFAGRFCDVSSEQWDRLTSINLNSIYYTTGAFLPDMYRRNSGHVINVSSGAGLVGLPDLSVYCATKWAVYGFTESLRLEAMADKKSGISFTSVHPGILKEGLFEGSRLNLLGEILLPRVNKHDDIAKAVINRGVKKKRAVVKKPRNLHIGPFARAFIPDYFLNRLLILAGADRCMSEWRGHDKIQEVKG